MRYRLYPSKDTTIIERKKYNTGGNEVAELWYGQYGITRHLTYFDMTPWISKINDGIVPSNIADTTCSLHFNNCYPSVEEAYGEDDKAAASFDLEVCSATTSWDEGNGYDIVHVDGEEGYANWYSATSSVAWTSEGGDFGDAIMSGHFDHGNENFSGFISDQVALWCGGTNHGVIVKYTDEYEALSGSIKNLVKFHTRDTHTNLSPYVQIDWDGQVKDERDEVGYELTKRLYFYLKKNGQYTNASDVSGVTITFEDEQMSSMEITTVVNQYPGIYYVDFTCPSSPATPTATTFTDTWGVDLEGTGTYLEIEKSGSVQSNLSSWDYDQADNLSQRTYRIGVPHIKDVYGSDEQVILDVRANRAYTMSTSSVVVMKNLEYRIDLVDGIDEYEMVGWEGVSYTDETNFILLDTSWFIPKNKYRLSFRTSVLNEYVVEHDRVREFWVKEI
jgi:hypothetical protein